MNWLIYGANGYTGRLLAREAVRQGLRPVLAGRSAASIQGLASELGLESQVFGLDDPVELARHLEDCRLVLHCAGPFAATSQPMIAACLAARVHYLDITGEIEVFANAQRQSDAASRADVVLLPGVGFDVVPSDCLAATLVRALPAAIELVLAFEAGGGPSPGTAKTSLERLGAGGMIRRDGLLTVVPLAYKSRLIPFAHGERMAVTIPWGDVYTAFVSTGVPNVEVYMALSPERIKRLRRLRWVQGLLATRPVRNFLQKRVARTVKGPSESRRDSTACQLWGEARSADGRSVTATMTTPNGYDLTVAAALGVARFLLEHQVEGGYYTPSLLLGPDFARSLPGVVMALGSVTQTRSD